MTNEEMREKLSQMLETPVQVLREDVVEMLKAINHFYFSQPFNSESSDLALKTLVEVERLLRSGNFEKVVLAKKTLSVGITALSDLARYQEALGDSAASGETYARVVRLTEDYSAAGKN